MSSNKLHNKDWQKYFSGEMSEKEKAQFKNSIADDEFALEAMEGFEDFEKEGGNVKKSISTISSKIAQRTGFQQQEGKTIPITRIASIAASVLIIVGGVFLTTQLLNNNKEVAQVVQEEEETKLETTNIENNNTNFQEDTFRDSSIVQPFNDTMIEPIPAEIDQINDVVEKDKETIVETKKIEVADVQAVEEIEKESNELMLQETVSIDLVESAAKQPSNYNYEEDQVSANPNSSVQPTTTIVATVNTQFDIGLEFYMKGKYNTAIDNFEQSIKEKEKIYESNYYIGLCFYSLGKQTKALKYFDEVIDTPSSLSNNAKWYTSAIYIERGKTEEAKSLLRELINSKSSFKTQAQEKLQTL